jgi:uncharacterized protein YdaU (DUF1376 family)
MTTISRKTRELFPCRVEQFLNDTIPLTPEQIGAYALLQIHCWRRGGSLPDNNRVLATLCKVSTRRWREILRPDLEPLFHITDGQWTHTTVSDDLKSREDLRQTRARAARQRHRKTAKPAAPAGRPKSKDHQQEAASDGGNEARDGTHTLPVSQEERRRRLLEAVGAEPVSGLIGPNGKRLGSEADMAEAAKWSAMGLTLDDQVFVIRHAMKRRAGPPPYAFRYFTSLMKVAAQKKRRA